MTESFFDWGILMQHVSHILFAVVALLIIRFTINHFIGRIVERIVLGHRYKTKREEKLRERTLTDMFKTGTAVVTWVVIAVVVLQEFGVNLAALATGAGLIGVVIGFGAQSMFKDFLGGTFIITENQYRIGDVVTVGGHSGIVEQITIRMTKLRDLDGSVYFIPNGEITSVRNMTMEYSGVVIEVGVSYDTEVSEAEEIINEVGKELAEDPEWKSRIIEPITFLRLDSFGDSSVNLKAVGKTVPLEQWNIAGEYRKRLKKAFEKKGIEIPFPQRVIHERKSSK
ncbi:MAG: mechanosensitive ion channel family protein [Candidatus Nomurabacteria bacterium]|nr:MAG: mechanosensitive ion channel family protein [Candidatus Nomurabacteria bacterium]